MDLKQILGVLFAIVAACLFNIAPLLQKEVLNKHPEISSTGAVSYYLGLFTNMKYLLSILLFHIGAAAFYFALKFIGLAVVNPLCQFGILIVVFGATKYLGEKLTLQAKIGIGLLLIMPFLIVGGNVTGPQKINTTTQFLAMCIGGGACLMGIVAFLAKYFNVLWAILISIAGLVGGVCMQSFSLNFDISNMTHMLLPNLVLVFGIVVFGGFSAYFLAPIAMQKMDVSIFSPVVASSNAIFSIIAGVFIYKQSIGNPVIYFAGLIFGLIAIFILGKYQ